MQNKGVFIQKFDFACLLFEPTFLFSSQTECEISSKQDFSTFLSILQFISILSNPELNASKLFIYVAVEQFWQQNL